MEELKNIAKKAMLMGIGLAVVTKEKADLTREKAKKMSAELLKKGKASEKEIKEFAEKIVNEVAKRQKFVRTFVEGEIKNAKAKSEIVAKQLKVQYEKELKELKQRLKAAEGKAKAKKPSKKGKK